MAAHHKNKKRKPAAKMPRQAGRIAAFIFLCAFTFTLAAGLINTTACAPQSDQSNRNNQSSHANAAQAQAIQPPATYKDVPGITADEIAAIENFQSQNRTFTYGMTHSTEAFVTHDGNDGGFAALFCQWLTDFLGVPVKLVHVMRSEMFDGLTSGRIDFTGDLTPTDERLETYYMTGAIAHRWLCYYRASGSEPLSEIPATRLPRYGLLTDSTVAENVYHYIYDPFEAIYIEDFAQAYEMMLSGEIDALIDENTSQAQLEVFGEIIMENFFPLLDSPVALAAQNPRLEPIISVVGKALNNGADQHLAQLYEQGYSQFLREKLINMLTEEERAFIAENPVILYAAEYDNYPSSFYNSRNQAWEGVVFDVLAEIEILTGLQFELAHDERAQWHEMFEMLENGEVLFVGELIWTQERDGRFLWPGTGLTRDWHVLISKSDFDNITINRVPTVSVGLPKATAHADLFNLWFPNHPHAVTFDSQEETINALLNDEVDMIMLSNNNMLYLINYLERVDIKPNLSFEPIYESTFGFNLNAAPLCSIFDKALSLIDTDIISDQWTQRSYDYRAVAAEARLPWLIGAVILSFAILFMSVLFFIINRKKTVAQAVLSDSEERLQIILDAVPLAANLWTEEYKNIATNAEAMRLFKVSSKQEYLDSFFDFSPEYQPDGELSKDKVLRVLKEAFAEGYNKFEWMHRTHDGESIPCEVTLIRMNYKEGYLVAGFSRDLRVERAATEKIHKIEEEKYNIEEARRQLLAILDMLPVGIIIVSKADGALLYGNQAAVKIYGATSYEIDGKGRNITDFLPEYQDDGRNSLEMAFQSLSRDGGLAVQQHKRLNGEVFWTRSAYCTIDYNGVSATLNAIEDITSELEHQQRLEDIALKEQEANQLKTRFLANMSHEVRTPMNAILGITEIELQNADLPPDTVLALRQIHESGDLLLNIINDILDLSKIEAGKLEIMPVRYDLPSLISDTVQLNRLRYENKPIEFMLEVDANTPLSLIGDELRLKQILINIISNAFKYTEKGEVRLSVYAESPDPSKAAEGDVELVFIVSDTGQGMSQEQLNQLFTDFTRFNMKINRSIIGTGLGMSITKRLIDMMNGEIRVTSAVNEGSVFTIRVPQGRVDNVVCGEEMAEKLRNFRFRSPTQTQSKASRMLREYMPYGSVLVVDDVESNLYVTRGMLLPYGLEIESVNSGIVAVDKIRTGRIYDIIFMDHMMPRMNGVEATKIIRETGYTGCIIALTANALVGQSEMFLKNGFDGYISKPIDSRELNHVLNEFIRNKKPPEVVEAARREQAETVENRRRSEAVLSGEAKAVADFTHGGTQLPELKEMFILDTENAISTLLDILGDSSWGFSEQMLESFEIAAHGMKSALAAIGEHELSDHAHRLELAAQEGDTSYLLLESVTFIDNLKALIERMKT